MSLVASVSGARDHALRAWRGLSPLSRDGLVAAVAAAGPISYVLTDGRGLDDGRRALWALLVLCVCAPLALRRRLPLTVAACSAVAATAAAVVAGRDVAFLVVALAIGSAGYHADGRRLPLTAAAVLWGLSFLLLGGGAIDLAWASTSVALGVAPAAFGYALRLQAERSANGVRLERARTEASRAEERARITRDVHDVVGHHLSAIRLQAVGARSRLAGDHPDANRALSTIAELSSRALGDIRELLDRLRADADATRPPTLDDLAELVTRLSGDDLEVHLTSLPGIGAGAAAHVQACVYRVVQESLTNVVRHSRASTATVRIDHNDGQLLVTVDDGGPPRHNSHGDRRGGVDGMRERVELLGGTFHAGPRGQHGWRVHAVVAQDAAP